MGGDGGGREGQGGCLMVNMANITLYTGESGMEVNREEILC